MKLSKSRKYIYWICKDCDLDFIVSNHFKKKANCPSCADNVYTEKIKSVYMDRPYNFLRHWTREELELLEDGLKSNRPYEEIANELNRTVQAVRIKIYRLKSKPNKATEKF